MSANKRLIKKKTKKIIICGICILLMENFSQTGKKMFLNDRMVRLTRISCISAYKSNSFNSCEVANGILSELLVI